MTVDFIQNKLLTVPHYGNGDPPGLSCGVLITHHLGKCSRNAGAMTGKTAPHYGNRDPPDLSCGVLLAHHFGKCARNAGAMTGKSE